MSSLKPSSRIVAFDLLRGFFLLVVIIDHAQMFPSGYELLSGRGQLWVSAAEGFFFLSGLLVGYIYRRKIAQGMAFVLRKLWSRAALLYVWAVALTLLYTAWGFAYGDPNSIKDGIYASGFNWDMIRQALLLDYVYGWSDFLAHYVVFMLWAPLALYLLHKRLWYLLVAISVALWFAKGDSFARAWQVIFYGGMLVGYYWRELQAWVSSWKMKRQQGLRRGILAATGLTILLSFINLFPLRFAVQHPDMLPEWLRNVTQSWYWLSESIWPYFEKWSLQPGRLLMFALWMTAGLILALRYAHRLPRPIYAMLNLFGQNSLYVYGVHSVFAFAIHAYLPDQMGFALNFILTTVLLGIMVLLTLGFVRYNQWRRHRLTSKETTT